MLNGSLNVEKRNGVDVGDGRGGSGAQNPRAIEEKVCHSRGLAEKTGRIPDRERAEIKMNRDSLMAQE